MADALQVSAAAYGEAFAEAAAFLESRRTFYGFAFNRTARIAADLDAAACKAGDEYAAALVAHLDPGRLRPLRKRHLAYLRVAEEFRRNPEWRLVR